MDFGELKNDTNFVNKVTNIATSLDAIEESLRAAVEFTDYESLTPQEKVKYDLYLSYSINSLFWMYVKLQGTDPNTHEIKNELSRVRQAMIRDKQVYERNTIRPVLDQAAAGRFVRHGLHQKKRKDDDRGSQGQDDNRPKNKITKFKD